MRNSTRLEYSLNRQINKLFLEDAGNVRVVPLYYDESDDIMLYKLLSKLNGVHFTGGGLTLINPDTREQHQYYKTAKKILEYSIQQKDQFNIDFPITGICQGFEALVMLVAGDNHQLLQKIAYFNQQRKIQWTADNSGDETGSFTNVKKESKIFSLFDQEIIDKLGSQENALHLHDYSTYQDDFMNNEKLNQFFKVIATDTDPLNEKPYVIIIEAKNYPIYAMMFHPEYQLVDQSNYQNKQMKLNSLENEVTQYTYKALSKFIKSQLMLNSHQFGWGLIEQFALQTSDVIINGQKIQTIEDYMMVGDLTVRAYALQNPSKYMDQFRSQQSKQNDSISGQLSNKVVTSNQQNGFLQNNAETQNEQQQQNILVDLRKKVPLSPFGLGKD
eukprot:403373142